VSGIFDAGIGEYDNNLAFIDLHQAQLLYTMKGKVSGIRLKVDIKMLDLPNSALPDLILSSKTEVFFSNLG
jgi:hypothetical protein